MSGVLAAVLRQREAQCPVIRSIAREILTCLVLQPIMNLASPGYINELIESLLLVLNDDGINWMGGGDESSNATTANHGHSSVAPGGVRHDNHTTSADWAQMLEAATQRRTEVLMPENLENMWTKGKNYKRRVNKKETSMCKPLNSVGSDPLLNAGSTNRSESPPDHHDMELCFEEEQHQVDEVNDIKDVVAGSNKYKTSLKRSNSAFALGIQPNKGESTMSEFYTHDVEKHGEGFRGNSGGSDMVVRREGHLLPKLRCRVMGAYFEKLGSKSFAVYSIAVTNGQEKTWFVKRR